MQKFREVMQKLLLEHAYDLVRFKESEYSRNNQMHEYRRAIEDYNAYLGDSILQDELELLLFHRYGEWLAHIRSKRVFDKTSEEGTIAEFRNKAAEQSVYLPMLHQKLVFYRVYFEDSRFEAEEKLLDYPANYDAWKRFNETGSVRAESEN